MAAPSARRSRIARRAEIDGELELAQHRGEPLGHLVGDAIEQERRRPEPLARARGARRRSLRSKMMRRLRHTRVMPASGMTALERWIARKPGDDSPLAWR